MFDEARLRCLRAVLDTIIPRDEYPGAWEAGVGEYLGRQLRGDLAESLPAYRDWLREIDAEARAVFGRAFADLGAADRTLLLARVERGEVRAEWSLDGAAFFALIVEHCGEGYYSDPGNGGNRDGIAWKMVGFEVRG